MRVVRQATTANAEKKYQFDVKGLVFLVKNFTSDDIFVNLKAGAKKEESILIPAETAQTITGMDLQGGIDALYITANETNEKGVEVQCIRW